ncbi:MAG: hypothetical protein OXM54_07390 [Acidimicrobiaceae bacterium]|nr:hypothetical protein [Acidimicrobiaceae bacterium]MDE0318895.1 hypothetical protein [Acidimicrobiaceae bacterium]
MKYLDEDADLTDQLSPRIGERAANAIVNALPRNAQPVITSLPTGLIVRLGDHRLTATWVGDGRLNEVRKLLSRSPHPDIAIGRQLSPGAKRALTDAGIGWVDETGAAEIAAGSVVVSRTGRPPQPKRTNRWAPAVFCITEVILCGTDATVAATHEATGLSMGSCTNALRFLAVRGLLESDAARGRGSGRRVADRDRLLEAYAQAAQEAAERQISVTVGVAWQDALTGIVEAGRAWDTAGIAWAATGTVAAAVMAPVLTQVGQTEVYVDAKTVVGLEAAAAAAGLSAMPAGRLVLRPFPSTCTQRLSLFRSGMRTAPWPRVYADLRRAGVRGEDAAEHLRSIWDES